MEEKILKEFLNKKVEDAKREIKEKGVLTEQNAMVLLMDFLFNHLVDLSNNAATKEDIERINERISNILKNMATKEDIAKIWEVMATKEDIAKIWEVMATKEDIAKINNIINDILKNMATKDDIAKIWQVMATKDDIKNMATKDDIKFLKFLIMFGFTFLALIIALLQLLG